jgi:hypothetical protein
VAGRMRLTGDRAQRIPSLPGWRVEPPNANPRRGHSLPPQRQTELHRLTNGRGLLISFASFAWNSSPHFPLRTHSPRRQNDKSIVDRVERTASFAVESQAGSQGIHELPSATLKPWHVGGELGARSEPTTRETYQHQSCQKAETHESCGALALRRMS